MFARGGWGGVECLHKVGGVGLSVERERLVCWVNVMFGVEFVSIRVSAVQRGLHS